MHRRLGKMYGVRSNRKLPLTAPSKILSFLFDYSEKTTYICKKFDMYSLKEYPEEFKQSKKKTWLKFKKKLKKIAHTQLRRGDKRYLFRGREIPW